MQARTVRVQRVEANEVAEILADEETIYVFATGPNQCFWMPVRKRVENWPNSIFETVRLEDWKEELGPFCRGKKLKARQSMEFREAFDKDFDFEKLSENGLIEESLDDFLRGARVRGQ